MKENGVPCVTGYGEGRVKGSGLVAKAKVLAAGLRHGRLPTGGFGCQCHLSEAEG